MKLVIDRTKWLRGEGSSSSYLLRKTDEKQCCIGFLCEALGISRDNLVGEKGSHVLGDSIKAALPTWLGNPSKLEDDVFAAYAINDDDMKDHDPDAEVPPVTSEEDREARITEIFARHDVHSESGLNCFENSTD